MPETILWFLPLLVPIAIWVSWSDMKFMKIPNKAVLTTAAVYLVAGLLVLPLQAWLWGWALLVIVLIVGYLANMLSLIGAGDAKFAAVMAPFFVGADIGLVMALFAACLLGAFTSHRLARSIGAIRRMTPDWLSWTSRDFPMGLALSGLLIFYPLVAAWLG